MGRLENQGSGLLALALVACANQATQTPIESEDHPSAPSATESPGPAAPVVVASMPPRQVLPFQHGSPVAAIDWSSDGTLLMTSALDGAIRVFGASDGQLRGVVHRGRTGLPPVARFSPSGDRIAVGDRDVLVYSSVPGPAPSAGWGPSTVLRRGEAANPVRSLAWSPDGRWLISHGPARDSSGEARQQLMLWDARDGSPRPLPDFEPVAHAPSLRLAFLDDDHVVVQWGTNATVVDRRRGATLRTWVLPRAFETLAVWNGEGVVADRRGFLLLDPDLERPVALAGTSAGPSEPNLLSIGRTLAVVGRGDGLTLHMLPNGESVGEASYPGIDWEEPPMRSRAVALQPSEARLAHAELSRIVLQRVPSLAPDGPEAVGHRAGPTALLWSADGRALASAGPHRVCMWQREGGEPRWCQTVATTGRPADRPHSLAWANSPDQLVVVAETWRATLETATGAIVDRDSTGEPSVTTDHGATDGTWLVRIPPPTLGPAVFPVVIHATSGERRATLDVTGSLGYLPQVATFSADGRWLALATPDTRIHVVDARRWLGD